MGAFWVHEKHADLLGAGTHGTTFGGTPLACAVALRIMEVIEREKLADNARTLGDWMKTELQRLAGKFPNVIKSARGLGFMLGFELAEKEKIPAFAASDKTASIQFVNRLHEAGLLAIPSGAQVIRLLPALNLTRSQAEEGVKIIESVVIDLSRVES
jgi:acetylornithine/succinyldiaminopimelate/putrescine aminotransferase